jgi:hypothetical protein
MRDNFSNNYKNLKKIYRDLHEKGSNIGSAENTFDGKSLRFFFQSIYQVIKKTKSNSLIDFGCGKAKYYFNKIHIKEKEYQNILEYWEIDEHTLYDPGVEKFSLYPAKKKDGVICIDVVEHIPEEDVINFIDDLFSLANKFVFIVIACYPAKKNLPDGRNVHLCIKDKEEWREIILNIKKKYPHISPFVICSDNKKYFPIS